MHRGGFILKRRPNVSLTVMEYMEKSQFWHIECEYKNRRNKRRKSGECAALLCVYLEPGEHESWPDSATWGGFGENAAERLSPQFNSWENNFPEMNPWRQAGQLKTLIPVALKVTKNILCPSCYYSSSSSTSHYCRPLLVEEQPTLWPLTLTSKMV